MICKLAFYLCIGTFCTAGGGALVLHSSDAIHEMRINHGINTIKRKSNKMSKELTDYYKFTLKNNKSPKIKG
ncbi:MAG: hypothetical protein PHD97_08825 [Bacteroidales bacterium]|nr:hypothetical protein [Bacteroidales bacterium]